MQGSRVWFCFHEQANTTLAHQRTRRSKDIVARGRDWHGRDLCFTTSLNGVVRSRRVTMNAAGVTFDEYGWVAFNRVRVPTKNHPGKRMPAWPLVRPSLARALPSLHELTRALLRTRRPFIVIRDQERKQRLHGIDAQKVTSLTISCPVCAHLSVSCQLDAFIPQARVVCAPMLALALILTLPRRNISNRRAFA